MSTTYDPTFGKKLLLGYDTSAYCTQQTKPALDLSYWFMQFPRPNFGSTVNQDDNTLQVTCAFADCDSLVSLCWSSEDTLDHVLASYATRTDYSGNTWTFSIDIDSNIVPFDQVNGLTLTIVNAQGTSYVRLWNYIQAGSTNTSATFKVDFSDVKAGWTATDPVDTTTISQMFLTFANVQYGQGIKLATYEYSTVTVKQIGFTGPGLVVNVPAIPANGLDMTLGYDDLYNISPKRLVDQIVNLGYTGFCTCYIGMSHFMILGWDETESRYKFLPQDNPINNAAVAWLTDLYNRLRSVGIKLIFSMSYEMFYSYIPYSWCQRDYLGNPALTGWVPPSSLMAFTNSEVINHLQLTAAQCLRICGSSDDKYFQIGEPWWWDGSYSSGHPCFYDDATTALFTAENPGQTMYVFQNTTDPVSTPQQVLTANWLQAKLGESTQTIAAYLKGQFTNLKTLLLFFTPQAFAGQLTATVNFPVNEWKAPNFDIFQIECYDEVTSGNIAAQDQQIKAIMPKLGYPLTSLQYFAGFVLYHSAAEESWPLIYEGMVDAYNIGIKDIAIWSYSQIVRDGVLILNGTPQNPVVGDCADCIVSLPVQPTTSMRYNMTISEGQNLVLKNVGTLNATYASDNVAQQLVTIQPGQFFSINQKMIALCIKVSSNAVVNLIGSGGAIAFNVSKMLFIDETLDGVEVSVPAGADAVPVTVAFFYVIAAT